MKCFKIITLIALGVILIFTLILSYFKVSECLIWKSFETLSGDILLSGKRVIDVKTKKSKEFGSFSRAVFSENKTEIIYLEPFYENGTTVYDVYLYNIKDSKSDKIFRIEKQNLLSDCGFLFVLIGTRELAKHTGNDYNKLST